MPHESDENPDLEAVWDRCLTAADVDTLIARVRGGEPDALAVLVERIGPWLRRVAGARWRRVDPASDVDDICQTAFRRLCDGHDRLAATTELQLRAWFRRLIENAIYDVARRAVVRRRDQRQDTAGAVLQELAGDAASPASALVQGERVAGLRAAIEQLDAVDRSIIDLHYGEGLIFRVIAERIGSTESAVNKRLQRLRNTLAQMLGELEPPA